MCVCGPAGLSASYPGRVLREVLGSKPKSKTRKCASSIIACFSVLKCCCKGDRGIWIPHVLLGCKINLIPSPAFDTR